MAQKIDLTKTFKNYYQAPAQPQIADFESALYLTIEGKGEPGGKEFSAKVEALYPVAYGIKKICKEQGNDFAVAKLEGLWWVEGKRDARKVPRSEWNWKLLIRMPEFVDKAMVTLAKEDVLNKKKLALSSSVNFEKMKNGKCVHIMHTGPYADEPATIDRMFALIASEGLKENGLHHEIYLSDPRKTAPSKMKTILRQPVR